jgi:capsular exopolysaccharide synthesis family protein
MSRIHEALKKAEQERVVQPAEPVTVPPQVMEAAPMVSSGAISTPVDIIAQTAAGTAYKNDFLRFEDILARCTHPEWHPNPNVNVFFSTDAGTHGAEQFRTLRSRLYQLRSTQNLRTLLVTSSIPGEGKTFVTTNLAQAIVRQPDRRALIIDADLRLPRLHVPLGAPRSPGLSNYLRGQVDEVSVIQNDLHGNLCIIPGGDEVTDPSELLSNGRMKVLLDRIAPVFDWVIIDSPPCLVVSDASVLMDLCDGALMVVAAGVTPSESAQRACQEFSARNLIGVVLNRAEEFSSYGEHAYYYGYSRNPVGKLEKQI